MARVDEVVIVFCDSTTALACTKIPSIMIKPNKMTTKSLDLRCYCIRRRGLKHTSTIRMIADLLTRDTASDAFKSHCTRPGLCRI